MPAEKPLSFEENLYLLEYISCHSYAKACQLTGMPYRKAMALKERVAFKEEYIRLTGTVLGRKEINAQRLFDELVNIAFLDIYEVIDEDLNLRPLGTMPDHVRRAVSGLEVTERYDKDGSLVSRKVVPKVYSKEKAIELLGKTAKIKMFREVIETSDERTKQKTMELEERIALMEKDRASIMAEKQG